MKRMHSWMLAAILTLCGIPTLCAQTSLAGRSYFNENIMQGEINKVIKEAEQKMDSVRTAAIASAEKGRKLTAKEQAEVNEKLQQAQRMMTATKKGMKIGIGVDFLNDSVAEMRTKIRVDDEVLKAAGVSWIKRKAMKAALAVAPEKEKGIYRLKGKLIIFEDPKEPDTMRLSDDGKYIFGKFDKKTSFKLTRTK